MSTPFVELALKLAPPNLNINEQFNDPAKASVYLVQRRADNEDSQRDATENPQGVAAHFEGLVGFFSPFGLCGVGGVASIRRNTSSSSF